MESWKHATAGLTITWNSRKGHLSPIYKIYPTAKPCRISQESLRTPDVILFFRIKCSEWRYKTCQSSLYRSLKTNKLHEPLPSLFILCASKSQHLASELPLTCKDWDTDTCTVPTGYSSNMSANAQTWLYELELPNKNRK